MSKDNDLIRLRHMLDAARKAREFVHGRQRNDLETDEQLTLALVRLLEVAGEAAKGVSASFREHHVDIPWKAIAGTRDRLIHGYFDIDLDIVWQIVTSDLPPLIARLEQATSPQ